MTRSAICTRRAIPLFAMLFLSLTAVASAKDAGDADRPAKLFESGDTLDISITAPWQELVRDESFQGSYPAILEYSDELGNSESLELTVERRGVTRQRICKYPPIKLRFAEGAAKGTTFRGQESLKMVTHCQSGSEYEQYYVTEMLAYRIYSLLTDFSFRVRPLSVSYQQAGGGDEEASSFSFFKKKTPEGPKFAFLIEEDKDVANRHDFHRLHIPRISPSRLDSYEGALLSLFQFMIGNTDWAATSGPDPQDCCHNTRLIGPEPTRPEDTLYALPYDFDSSGLVDSKYAAPAEALPIRSVTQRVYRGYCAHNEALEDARRKMLDEEQAVYGLIRGENRLSERKRDQALRYLEGFYEIVKDDKKFKKTVTEKCRG